MREQDDALTRRAFLGAVTAAIAGALLEDGPSLPPRPSLESHPVACGFLPAIRGADDPFASSSTPAILKRLNDAAPAEACRLLSILANSKIIDDPKLADLEKYLKHKDGRIVAAALEVVGHREGIKIRADFTKSYLEDDRAAVRLAAVDLLARRKDLPCGATDLSKLMDLAPAQPIPRALHIDALLELIALRSPEGAEKFVEKNFVARGDQYLSKAKNTNFRNLDALDLCRAARDLSPQALTAGAEIRIGKIILEKSGAKHSPSHNAMPLLHALGAIDESLPSFFDRMRKAGHFDKFCAELSVIVEQRRKEDLENCRALFRKPANVLLGIHDDLTSWIERSEERMRDLLKPAKPKELVVLYPTVAESSIEPPKKAYLEALGRMLKDREAPLIVWNSGHGGQAHFWFMNGSLGEHLSEDMHHPKGVSYQEMADLMLERRRGKSVELSDVTLIQDACFQFDFAVNLCGALVKGAAEKGLELASLPRIVTAAQRGQPSWLSGSFQAQVEEPEKLPYTNREPGSYLQNTFREVSKGKAESLMERLLRADEMLNAELTKELDQSGAQLEGQDLAVFSPRMLDVVKLVSEISERLKARGIDLPEQPPVELRASPRGARFMLIAQSESNRLDPALA